MYMYRCVVPANPTCILRINVYIYVCVYLYRCARSVSIDLYYFHFPPRHCHGRFIEELQKKAAPTTVCGHVFADNEPTYVCNDCAMDPTCVMCDRCFHNSPHKMHNFRVRPEYEALG